MKEGLLIFRQALDTIESVDEPKDKKRIIGNLRYSFLNPNYGSWLRRQNQISEGS